MYFQYDSSVRNKLQHMLMFSVLTSMKSNKLVITHVIINFISLISCISCITLFVILIWFYTSKIDIRLQISGTYTL